MTSPHHINPAFDESLAGMDQLLADMEDAIAAQIADTRQAFDEMNAARATGVRKKDKQLNRMAEAIEEQVIAVLVRHQPMAEDLRHTVGALKMSIEYERSGDYVKHLARSIAKLAVHNEDLAVFPSLLQMIDEVSRMFSAYVKARRASDVDAAIKVWLKDERIDDLCSEAVREAFENQKKGDGNVHSLINAVSVAKNSERLGDKIKNLVEIFYLQVTGEALDIKTE